MSTTASISSLIPAQTKSQGYKVTASVGGDGTVDTGTSSTTGTGQPSNITGGQVKKDDFLLLLVTQMRYQDPMSPMDNSQMLAQLAQFQTLEGNQNMVSAVNKLNDSYTSTADAQKLSANSMSSSSAISMIGKQVTIRQDSVSWDSSSGAIPIMVHVGMARSAKVEIMDGDGTVIKTIETDTRDSYGDALAQWDGTDDTGMMVPSGEYSIAIEGSDTNPALYAFVRDTVSGVRFEDGAVKIRTSAGELDMKNLMDVTEPAAGSTGYGSLTPSTAVTLLGKEVRIKELAVAVKGVDNESIQFKVNLSGLPQAKVSMVDGKGNVVADLTATADANGVATVNWDTRNSTNGQFVNPGTYRIRVEHEDEYPMIYAYTEGLVQGISNLSGATLIRVNGRLMSVDQIIDIAEPAVVEEGVAT